MFKTTTTNPPPTVHFTIVTVVVVTGILLLFLIILTLSLLLCCHKRTHKSARDSSSTTEDALYSTLDRGPKNLIQPSTNQIHLSPSTGQIESKTAKDISSLYSSVTTENFLPISTSETETNKLPEDTMYAAVDKKKKKKKSREASNNSKKNYPTDAEIVATENQAKAQDRPSLEEMYAVVHKKPKKSEEQEKMAPSIPAHTVESLYTAVHKMPQ